MPNEQHTTEVEQCPETGELERYAIDHALRAAWVSKWWSPWDTEFGYTDYFEAIAERNLSLLHGFEELAEDADRKGVLPQPDSAQTQLVTDGGGGGE